MTGENHVSRRFNRLIGTFSFSPVASRLAMAIDIQRTRKLDEKSSRPNVPTSYSNPDELYTEDGLNMGRGIDRGHGSTEVNVIGKISDLFGPISII